jgi:drug/metabolite transporter (DMT)-like permease
MRRPLLALVVASLLWGAAVSGTKYALGGFGPVTLLSIELVAAIIGGVGGYGVSFLLFNTVIVAVNAGWAAVVLNLIPVFGFLSAVIFLGENVTAGDATGAVLAGASVLYFTLADRRAAAAEPQAAAPATTTSGR